MYWFFTLLVAGIVVTVALVAVGRGSPMAIAHPDRRYLNLPADRALTAADLYDLRLDLGLRGYRMDEVDDLLDRLANELDERDALIAELQRDLASRTPGAHAETVPQPPEAP